MNGYVKRHGKWLKPLKFLGLVYDPFADTLTSSTRNGAQVLLEIGKVNSNVKVTRQMVELARGVSDGEELTIEQVSKIFYPEKIGWLEAASLGKRRFDYLIAQMYKKPGTGLGALPLQAISEGRKVFELMYKKQTS